MGAVPTADGLGSLSTDSTGQLNVLGHYGDPFSVDGGQVGVFEKTHEICLRSLLERHDSRALESEISLKVLSDFPDQPLEGHLAEQQLGSFLVSSDLPQGNGARPISVGFLHAASSRCTLPSSFGSQLFSRSFPTGRLSCGLLSTGHVSMC